MCPYRRISVSSAAEGWHKRVALVGCPSFDDDAAYAAMGGCNRHQAARSLVAEASNNDAGVSAYPGRDRNEPLDPGKRGRDELGGVEAVIRQASSPDPVDALEIHAAA